MIAGRTEQVAFRNYLCYLYTMRLPFLCILFWISTLSCDQRPGPLFAIRKGPELGIDFQNTINTNDTLNALTFEYIYNGSGVGVGDFDRDGMQDLYFGGNQASGKLYLNKGGLKFEDVTARSGTQTGRWVTGVSVVDINQDGLDDLYLCVAGKTTPEERRNLLFINQGVKDGTPVFIESSRTFNLDDDSYSTMAAFFDYDKDGDPDMYLLNNWLEKYNRNNLRPKRVNGEAESTDRLYRNNGDNTFTNVSEEAGILVEGYGLGIVVCDINHDSWPDVYVSNDFLSNDILWINKKDGAFENRIGDYLKHQAHNGMGVDMADFNNDGLPDIAAVDMLPPGHKRQKLMTPGQNYDFFHMALEAGYQPQYMRNTLQLNRGPDNEENYLFSEIAFMAGVAKTDWSWAPLFADFDNDGYKDLFIGNGYRKDVTNLDFVFFGLGGSPFGTVEKRKEKINEELENLPDVQLSNYVFKNTGSLVFEDKSKEWGIELPTFTNGAAYADLDNDGDLDLITNNIDQEVILFENTARKQAGAHRYIRLVSTDGSRNQKVWVFADGKIQFIEMTPYRGFQSTVEPFAHFGLGSTAQIDSVLILWPDSTFKKYFSIAADTTLAFTKEGAEPMMQIDHREKTLFSPAGLLDYRHIENSPSDILSTRTLLHELTRFGPCLAKGDINGDGLDDFFVGGESHGSSAVFVQSVGGTFSLSQNFPAAGGEDGGALFADVDNDNDADLYIAGASPAMGKEASPHRLYLNDGSGRFTAAAHGSLPEIYLSASCAEGADIDNDGDIDLFVGGRILTADYPASPRSYILRNDGGVFTDITKELNPDLAEPGMVSTAAWADIDKDGKTDLILAGEWAPIRVFTNTGTRLKEVTGEFGLENSDGWWNCLVAADLNGDGYADLVAGNSGSNSFFRSSPENPVQIVAKDFDNNGSIDPVITYYNDFDKERFMVHNRLVLVDQIPKMKARFETFTRYATTPFSKAFSQEEISGAFTGSAYKLESVVLLNRQGKGFDVIDLPEIVQVSTVNDIVVEDINDDGNADLLLIGNNYAQETLFGRYDASLGMVLLGDGKLGWTPLPHYISGILADGNTRYIELLRSGNGSRTLLISNNNDKLQFFVRRRAESVAGDRTVIGDR